jgi:hypothetical protein
MAQQRQIPEGRKALYYLGMALIVLGFVLFIASMLISPIIQHHTTPSSGLVFHDSNGNLVPPPLGFPLSSATPAAPSFSDFESNAHHTMIQSLFAMLIIVAGSVMMSIGKRGLAGAGVILDPEAARSDVEPWSRMAGGMVKDALDEAEIKLGSQPATDKMPFDERLHRLQKLRQEGLLSEPEYEAAKKKILESA